MLFILLLLYGGGVFILKLIVRDMLNPIFVFTVIWGAISVLASANMFGINETSDAIYGMTALGVFFFVVGGFCVIQMISKKKYYTSSALRYTQGSATYRNRIFFILQIMALITFFVADIQSFLLIRSGHSIADMYAMKIQMGLGNSTLLSQKNGFVSIFLEYLARPILAISIPYGCVTFFKYKNKKQLLITVLMLFLAFFTRFNRMDIMIFVISFICCFVILGNKDQMKKIYKKYKRFVIIFSVIGIVLFSIITINRGIESFGKAIYYYFCGNMPFCNVKIEKILPNHINTWGLTSYNGVLRPFLQMLEGIGISPDLVSVAETYINVEQAEVISNTGSIYNAFVGPFYFFYCDLGVLGIIVYSFVFGVICEQCYMKMKKIGSDYYIVFYLILLVRGIVLSFYNFIGTNIAYGVALILLLLLKNNINKTECLLTRGVN